MKTKLGMAFRAAQPRLRTRERAESCLGKGEMSMCYALDSEDAYMFLKACALDGFGMEPDYGTPGSGFFVRPLTYYTAASCPSHVFDEAYSTRVIFLELLAILADEGWTAKDATKKEPA